MQPSHVKTVWVFHVSTLDTLYSEHAQCKRLPQLWDSVAPGRRTKELLLMELDFDSCIRFEVLHGGYTRGKWFAVTPCK